MKKIQIFNCEKANESAKNCNTKMKKITTLK